MSSLTQDHIAFIIRDLNQRGIVLEGFQDEVIDHVCSAVDKQVEAGRNFKEAYDDVIRSFGDIGGLHTTQAQVIRAQQSSTMSMLKNYFLTGVRNHLRQRFYTLINVAGLAVGLASFLIISLYVIHELSYDRHYANADRIFRVDQEIKFGANHIIVAQAPATVAELLQEDYPDDIEYSTRLNYWGARLFTIPGKPEIYKEEYVAWADSTFFGMFPQVMLEGNPRTALAEPNSVVISKSVAEKYFPGEPALGKSIIFDEKVNYAVTGVFEDMPKNSHMYFDMLRSTTGQEFANDQTLLGGSDMTTYIRLSEGITRLKVEEKLDNFVDKHVSPQMVAVMGNEFTMEKFRAAGERWNFSLMPITAIHLHSHKLGELRANGNIAYVYLFAAIGFFILCIACINFMNLSTARSALRAKEVGVRKVMGSLRSHLVKQFLTESTILCFMAVVVSVLIALLLLPTFNELAGKELFLPFNDPSFYWILIVAALAIGALAGLYPSVFLSAFKPIAALKGGGPPASRTGIIRSSLVVFQFVISILLIIGTLAINM